MNNLAHLLPAHISSGEAAGDGIAAERSDGAAKGGAKAGSLIIDAACERTEHIELSGGERRQTQLNRPE